MTRNVSEVTCSKLSWVIREIEERRRLFGAKHSAQLTILSNRAARSTGRNCLREGQYWSMRR
jgi:hypothetical protein